MSRDPSQAELRTISRLGRRIEDAGDLLDVALRVGVDLVLAQSRPRDRLARRITDHRGEVADDQHGDVTEVLEAAQPAQHDREAQVDVGGGWVDAELHPQRPAGLELLPQLGLGDHVDRAHGEQLDLTVDVHGRRR